MLRLTKKLLFGIEAVLDVAYNAKSRPVQASAITKRQGIPKRYLEQVLQALVRAGVLTGQRGPKGGYRLARDPESITIAEIVNIVRTIEVAPDPLTGAPASALGHRIVRPIWMDLQTELLERLGKTTLAELVARAREAGVESET
ncbi:MAG: Rrf2 family transcriptional regulator [Alphaproteobacteria bacterium]|jgi:Rrf2 family protein|nr:Rrf2 family transcriptional regulator [Alphaproteobacteria bacterium]